MAEVIIKEHDFDPRNLPPELLAAIGLAVAASAQTESVIEMGIAACAGLDTEYGAALTTHMNAPQRDSALRALAEIRIDDLNALDELDELLDAIKKAFEKRNAIVHHTWFRHAETKKTFTVKTVARSRVEMDLIPMSIEKVRADALEIYDAGMQLMGFLGDHELLPGFPPAVGRARGHKSRAERKKRRERGQAE